MLQSSLHNPLMFPSLKSVQPVQPVPPFYRTLLSPGDMVSPPVSLPTSPIMPSATNTTALMEHQGSAPGSHNPSEAGPLIHRPPNHVAPEPVADPMPKKKPRKSSMPVKIEKEVIDVADGYDEKDEEDDDEGGRPLNGLPGNQGCHQQYSQQLHANNGSSSNNNNNNNANGSGGSCHQSPSQDEMSPGLALRAMLRPEQEDLRGGGSGELRCMDSFTSEDQDHERDFENESETSDSKMCCADEMMEHDDLHHHHHHHQHHHHQHHRHMGGGMDRDREQDLEEAQLRKEMEEKNHSLPSPHQPVIKIKEELSDPTYDMFCMSQYGLYNGVGGMAAAAAAASMAALHESFVSSMSYASSPPKFSSSHSSEGDLCSSPDPKICYVCKKSFKSSYSVKLHYKNVHLKEMHVCTVAGCNAAFPSRRSRDRPSDRASVSSVPSVLKPVLRATRPRAPSSPPVYRCANRHCALLKRLFLHSANINLHRKLLTKELDDLVLDPHHSPLPRDLRDDFLAKIYGGHALGLEAMAGAGGGRGEAGLAGGNGVRPHQRSSSSVRSSPESDECSDEGILLDDEESGACSDGEDCGRKAEGPDGTEGGGGRRGDRGEAPPRESSGLLSSSAPGGVASNGGILCNICHKMYSNKGTLRVHYKTVHLREMHKCKVPGCNMMFSSVRSRNRHSQNPNLHKNVPFATMAANQRGEVALQCPPAAVSHKRSPPPNPGTMAPNTARAANISRPPRDSATSFCVGQCQLSVKGLQICVRQSSFCSAEEQAWRSRLPRAVTGGAARARTPGLELTLSPRVSHTHQLRAQSSLNRIIRGAAPVSVACEKGLFRISPSAKPSEHFKVSQRAPAPWKPGPLSRPALLPRSWVITSGEGQSSRPLRWLCVAIASVTFTPCPGSGQQGCGCQLLRSSSLHQHLVDICAVPAVSIWHRGAKTNGGARIGTIPPRLTPL
ncbi:hypothetical protein SKAU_G00080960 [Synaphobranchus kaupii]|uniref:C2H2-type domain-containing protein n=1 Tax=Synaphobranchus kaupii TaxID=118154 RepID=A0A9Q1FVM8_SYNKA|nr:hypothetical protein SKAU_G00080960 [Synaphobranchus kaupii]